MKTKLMILLSVVLLMFNACEKPLPEDPENGGEDIENPDNPNTPDNPDNPDDPDNPGPSQRLPRPKLEIVPKESDQENRDAFYIQWKAIKNACAYEWTIDDSEPQRIEENRILFEDLGYGDFTVNVKAISGSDKYKDSFYASLQFANRPLIPEYEAWLGEYTMISEKTLVHPTEKEGMKVKDEPVTLNIRLDHYPSVSLGSKVYYGYKVYGLSKEYSTYFSVAIFDPEHPDEVKLMNQVTYGEPDEDGFLLQWMGYGEYQGVISIVPGPQFFPITFKHKNGAYEVELATKNYQDGEIRFLAYDMLDFNAEANAYHSVPTESAYGPFTFSRNDQASVSCYVAEDYCPAVIVGRE